MKEIFVAAFAKNEACIDEFHQMQFKQIIWKDSGG